MTLRAAFALLNPPLIFGNPKQVEALRQIELVHECLASIEACEHDGENRDCPKCDGTGYTWCSCSECDNEHKRPCKTCDGEGTQEGDYCKLCLDRFPSDVYEEAVKMYKRRHAA